MAVAELDPDFSCRFAGDGVEALALLKDEHFTPGIIFMDLNMPRMSGNECLTEIKQNPRIRDIPVYIYSTSADPKLKEECMELGAQDFIVKPSGFQALTDILRTIIV